MSDTYHLNRITSVIRKVLNIINKFKALIESRIMRGKSFSSAALRLIGRVESFTASAAARLIGCVESFTTSQKKEIRNAR